MTAVAILAIIAAVAEGAPQYFGPTSFRDSLFSAPALSSFGAVTPSIAPRTFGSVYGNIAAPVAPVAPAFRALPAVPAVPAPAALPAGVSAEACPNYPFCDNLEAVVKSVAPQTSYNGPSSAPQQQQTRDCKQIKDIQFVQQDENECEEVTEEKCYFNTVYKNMCSEEKEEVCEEKENEEGKFEQTDNCQELEKTVCKEVATPEEVCNDVTKQECNVVTKKVPKQVTKSVCAGDPDYEKYKEDEEEQEGDGVEQE